MSPMPWMGKHEDRPLTWWVLVLMNLLLLFLFCDGRSVWGNESLNRNRDGTMGVSQSYPIICYSFSYQKKKRTSLRNDSRPELSHVCVVWFRWQGACIFPPGIPFANVSPQPPEWCEAAITHNNTMFQENKCPIQTRGECVFIFSLFGLEACYSN